MYDSTCIWNQQHKLVALHLYMLTIYLWRVLRIPRGIPHFMTPSAKNVTTWFPCFWNITQIWRSPTTMASTHCITLLYGEIPGKESTQSAWIESVVAKLQWADTVCVHLLKYLNYNTIMAITTCFCCICSFILPLFWNCRCMLTLSS